MSLLCPECGRALKNDMLQCNYCGMELSPTPKSEQENINDKQLKILHNNAERYYSAYAKLNKCFSLLTSILLPIGAFFLAFAYIKLMSFIDSNPETWEDWANLFDLSESIKSQIKTFLILSAMTFTLSKLVDTCFPSFIRFIISRKIDRDNFDYRSYCKSISPLKERSEGSYNQTKYALPATIEAHLFLLACKEKIDPSVKKYEIVKGSIKFILWLSYIIPLFIGFYEIANTNIFNVLWNESTEFSFQFHSAFIIAIVLFVLRVLFLLILDRIIPQEEVDMDDWLTTYQSK